MGGALEALDGGGAQKPADSFLDTLSRWLARAKIPHMGGKCGNPRTCKGLFSRISYRLAQMEEAADTADEDKASKILQHFIPDLVINGRPLTGNGFLAGRKSVADLKTLSPCDLYSNDRTGNPNAVVNARQKKSTPTIIPGPNRWMHGEATRAMVLKRSSTPTVRVAGYLDRWSGLLEKCLMT